MFTGSGEDQFSLIRVYRGFSVGKGEPTVFTGPRPIRYGALRRRFRGVVIGDPVTLATGFVPDGFSSLVDDHPL